jgi:outer membrane immunogenic protein
MKKLFLLLCLLPMLASVGFAQESRQDVSASFIGTYQPTITGNAVKQTSTFGKGVLLGYRFMLTPSSAIEGNYSYSQMNMSYFGNYGNAKIHTSMQEGSVAYVRSFVYKKFNPFAEGGVGILLFRPIDDSGTTTNAVVNTKATAGLFGGGIAYELSPSWDLRVQYRAFILKSVDFGLGNSFSTNRYYIMQQPAIGVAYHF